MNSPFGRRLLVIGVPILGLALFGATLATVDVPVVIGGLRRTGAGFLIILLLAGVRLALRAAAWSVCSDPEHRLPFRSTLEACVVGETLGSLTPLGPVASEPAKVLWVGRYAPTVEASAALALETTFYTVSVAVVLATGGALVARAVWPTPEAWMVAAAIAAVAPPSLVFLHARRSGRDPIWTRALDRLERWCLNRVRLRPCADAIARTRATSRDMASNRPGLLVLVAGLEFAFQAAAVAEVYVTLVLLGAPNATPLHALFLECANRAVTVVFKFVPLRLGVDELASGLVTGLTGVGGAVGVAVAVVRKGRVLCWTLPGLALLGGRAWMAPHASGVPDTRKEVEEPRVCCES